MSLCQLFSLHESISDDFTAVSPFFIASAFSAATLISTRRNRPGTRGQMLATAVTPRLHLHTARAVLGRDWKRHVLLATCLGANL